MGEAEAPKIPLGIAASLTGVKLAGVLPVTLANRAMRAKTRQNALKRGCGWLPFGYPFFARHARQRVAPALPRSRRRARSNLSRGELGKSQSAHGDSSASPAGRRGQSRKRKDRSQREPEAVLKVCPTGMKTSGASAKGGHEGLPIRGTRKVLVNGEASAFEEVQGICTGHKTVALGLQLGQRGGVLDVELLAA